MRGRKEKKNGLSVLSRLEKVILWALSLTLLWTPFQKENGTFQAEKLKLITHAVRPRMKSRKLGMWQEGKRSKTGNWFGQTCGKSRQPTRPLMEVPIRQPLPLHPALSSALSSCEDLFQRSGASVFWGKHGRITFYQAMLHWRRRWHAGSMFLRRERGKQPQPAPLILI